MFTYKYLQSYFRRYAFGTIFLRFCKHVATFDKLFAITLSIGAVILTNVGVDSGIAKFIDVSFRYHMEQYLREPVSMG